MEKCENCPCPGTCLAQMIENRQLCELADPHSPRYNPEYLPLLKREHPPDVRAGHDRTQYPLEYVYGELLPPGPKVGHVPGVNLPPPPADFSPEEYAAARAQGGVPVGRISPAPSGDVAEKSPGPVRQAFRTAANFGKAVLRHAANAFTHATPEEQGARLEICRGDPAKGIPRCDRYDEGRVRCKECGCFLIPKTGWASEECPLGKWHAIRRQEGSVEALAELNRNPAEGCGTCGGRG